MEKRDPYILRRFVAPMFTILTLMIGLVVAVLLVCSKPPSNQAILTVVAAILTGVGALAALDHLAFARYRCPQCKTRLPRHQDEPERKGEYRFCCRQCDVIWNTGIRQGNGE